MTVTDLITQFRTSYDIGSLGLPGFEDNEIKELLDIEIYRTISRKFGGNNIYGSKFPDSPKRIDDLKNLIRNAQVTPSTSRTTGMYVVILPSEYLHLVELSVNLTDNGTTYEEEATQIDYSKIARFQNSRKNQGAYIKNPVFVFDEVSAGNNLIRLYLDTQYIADYSPTILVNFLYITKPTQSMKTVGASVPLVDFNIDVLNEIVTYAVDSAISIATPNKSQVSQQQLNKIE